VIDFPYTVIILMKSSPGHLWLCKSILSLSTTCYLCCSMPTNLPTLLVRAFARTQVSTSLTVSSSCNPVAPVGNDWSQQRLVSTDAVDTMKTMQGSEPAICQWRCRCVHCRGCVSIPG